MREPNFLVKLEKDDREVLKTITDKHSEKSSIVLRAKIILMADAGEKHQISLKNLRFRVMSSHTGKDAGMKRWINRYERGCKIFLDPVHPIPLRQNSCAKLLQSLPAMESEREGW